MTARIPTPPASPQEITIFVLGGNSTGKTRIIERYWLDEYKTQHCPLLESADPRMDRTIAGTRCMLTFVEIGIPQSWIRDPTEIYRQWESATTFPHAAMLVYSVSGRHTLEALQTIWPALKRYFDRGKCRVVEVVAAKSDDGGEVTIDEERAWAKQVGAAFGECSAREGKGVTEVVEKLVLGVLEEREREKEITSPQERTDDPNIRRSARMIKYLRHRICG
ncbi:P-loop containing nucleoside triphosphate hydrolase protein [Mytilinidion resinicola]|uniref:P-loop containing nucleoside triphosphate hydrolase protein n=1 Tax=Mytilinidion resinicola TaxID=574789 RepID=A0A6A6YPA7_9PEZI|nr:P-loop containing nucleoside triphosphate hydrolase protein [Mytilinidion resinicola]KAF2810712.1 P-loop containing nucleoside triphosphate hydrolase protein [Mytilinidion resinicola]